MKTISFKDEFVFGLALFFIEKNELNTNITYTTRTVTFLSKEDYDTFVQIAYLNGIYEGGFVNF